MQIIESKKAINIYRFLNKLTRIKWFKLSEVWVSILLWKKIQDLAIYYLNSANHARGLKNNPGSWSCYVKNKIVNEVYTCEWTVEDI